jgi:hypothetical protein
VFSFLNTSDASSSKREKSLTTYLGMNFYEQLKQEHLVSKPQKWTARHVDFLCSFEDAQPAPDVDCTCHEPSERVAGAVAMLLKRTDTRYRERLMEAILTYPGFEFE